MEPLSCKLVVRRRSLVGNQVKIIGKKTDVNSLVPHPTAAATVFHVVALIVELALMTPDRLKQCKEKF